MKYTGKYITFDVPESWADTVDFREEENSIAASYRGLPLVVFAFPENPESISAAQGFEALGTLTDGTSTRTLMAEFPEVSNIMGDPLIEQTYYSLSLDLHELFRSISGSAPWTCSLFAGDPTSTGFYVTDLCLGCPACYEVCPQKCIDLSDVPVQIDQVHCLRCGLCKEACPLGAIEQR